MNLDMHVLILNRVSILNIDWYDSCDQLQVQCKLCSRLQIE